MQIELVVFLCTPYIFYFFFFPIILASTILNWQWWKQNSMSYLRGDFVCLLFVCGLYLVTLKAYPLHFALKNHSWWCPGYHVGCRRSIPSCIQGKCIYWDNINLSLFSLNVVYYSDWFAYLCQPYVPGISFSLTLEYNSYNALLNFIF